MKKLTHEEILEIRKQNQFSKRTPISLLLNDIRSLHNVGAIFRIADGIRAEKIYLCGITGKPSAEGEARHRRPNRMIAKTALGAEVSVPWEYHAEAFEIAKRLKKSGTQLIVLEHTDSSVLYSDAKPQAPVCLIIGNEVTGVDQNLVELADLAVEIPMMGEKNSLNASVAAGILAYRVLENLGFTLAPSAIMNK